MKQKMKDDLFTSRPEPPTLTQIAEDIFKADEDDPVFDTFKKSRSGAYLLSAEFCANKNIWFHLFIEPKLSV